MDPFVARQMLAAVEAGNLELEAGLEVIPAKQYLTTRFGSRNYTLLHYACQQGKVNVIQRILDRSMELGCDLNEPFRTDPTPIDVARENHHDNIVSFLTDMLQVSKDGKTVAKNRSTNTNSTSNAIQSAQCLPQFKPQQRLTLASMLNLGNLKKLIPDDIRFDLEKVASGNLENLEEIDLENLKHRLMQLMQGKEDIDGGNGDYITRGVGGQVFNATGRNKLKKMMNQQLPSLMQLMKDSRLKGYQDSDQQSEGIKLQGDGTHQLHMVAFQGDLSEVRKIVLEGNGNVNDLDNEGRSPLFHAAYKGHSNVVEFFTSKACDLAICDKYGRSALHYATNQGHSDVVCVLLKVHGCDPMIKDNKGSTPLHVAAYNGFVDIFKLLAEHPGCKPNVPDGNGKTCVHIACYKGFLPILELLVQTYNCSVNDKDYQNGVTGLHLAALKGHVGIMTYLNSLETSDFETTDLTFKTPLYRACQYNQLQSLKYLVEQAKCNPVAQDEDGTTPLHVAALNGYTIIVKYLLSIPGLDCSLVDDNHKRTVLHYASQNGSLELIQLLLEKCNLDPNHGDSQHGYRPIHLAANNGNISVLRYLCARPGADPDVADFHNRTPLFYACQNGHSNAAKYLIKKHQLDPNHVDSEGVSCIMVASLFGHNALIKQLKKLCPEIDETNIPKGVTTNPILKQFDDMDPAKLHSYEARAMAIKGSLKELKEVIQNSNLDVKTDKGPNGELILHNASFAGHLNIVKYLVDECGCDFMVRDDETHTSIHNAAHEGFTEIIKFFSQHEGFVVDIPDGTNRTPLHYAAQNGHFDTVQLLVKQLNCSAFYSDVRDVLPFQLAAGNGHMKILKFFASLPEAKEKMAATDSAGRTAVHDASQYGRLETVKYLVTECGLSATTRGTNMGTTPLHLAAGNGFLPLVEFFCSLDECMMDELDDHGRTPLHYACQEGQLQVIKYLVKERNCNPSLKDKRGVSPLHLAALADGSVEAVKFLSQYSAAEPAVDGDLAGVDLSQGSILQAIIATTGDLDKLKAAMALPEADPHAKGLGGKTPLHVAALYGHFKIVEYLVTEHKVAIDPTDNNLFTPFHDACYNGHLKIAQFLKGVHCQTDLKNELGRTALHHACQNGHSQVVRFLVNEVGCDGSSSDKTGTTPFQLAAYNGKMEIAKFLASKGCDTVAIDNQGRTSLHCACQEGHLHMVKFLVNECKVDVYQTDSVTGIMGIHLAAAAGHIGIVKFLCTIPESDPDVLENRHRSSLHYACEKDKLKVVQYLVEEQKCDINLEDEIGLTPQSLAIASQSTEVIKYLQKKAEEPSSAGLKDQSCTTNDEDIKKRHKRGVEKQKKRIENRITEYKKKKAHPQGIIFIVGIYGADGTDIDVENVKKAFEYLNFVTFLEKDPSAEDVLCLIEAAAKAHYPVCRAHKFQYVAFYFAGHGGMTDNGEKFIACLQEENEVLLIHKQIIDPLSCLHKNEIRRIFLFDCCQSKVKCKVVPYKPRDTQLANPGELIAYATNEGKKAWGDDTIGGIWTHHLCKNIQKMRDTPFITVVSKTYEDVTSVKKDFQQPFLTSTFGDRKLLPIEEPDSEDQACTTDDEDIKKRRERGVEKQKKRIQNRMLAKCKKKAHPHQGIIFIVGITGTQGADIDMENVKKAFEYLNFVTFLENDPTAEDVLCLIEAATQIDYPVSRTHRFQYVAFYFAGNGGMTDDGEKFIACLEEENEVLLINKHIIDPLKDLHREKKISRIFLFDCCQSKARSKCKVIPFKARDKRQPSNPGEFILYATNESKKASGDEKIGGIWTHHLCKNIQEMPNQPFINVVSKTYEDVSSIKEDFQEPFLTSTFGNRKLLPKELHAAAAGHQKNGQKDEQSCKEESTAEIVVNQLKPITVEDVYECVKDEASKWSDFAIELNIEDSFRDLLHEDTAKTDEDKMKDVIQHWIENKPTEVSWNTMITVVRVKTLNCSPEIAVSLNKASTTKKCRTVPISNWRLVYMCLRLKAKYWSDLGVYLGICDTFRDNLAEEKMLTNERKLEKIIREWMSDGKEYEVSWDKIIEVAEELGLDEEAIDLKKKLKEAKKKEQ